MKTACAVSLTDEQLGALDDYFADLVDELKRDMEAVCEENEKQCQNAITAFVDEIRQNAAKTENDDALRTAAEEALGVVILFPGPDKGTKERLENVEALLKMKLDTPDEKEREEVSKAYRKAFDFEDDETVKIQLNGDPVVVHFFDAAGCKHQLGEFDVGKNAIEAIE